MKQEKIEPGVTYHIYNRGNNRENLFKEEKNYYHFLNLVKRHLLPIVDLYAYCLLKNHFHLLLRVKDIDDLPIKYQAKPYVPFSNFFNAYAKSINTAYGRSGSLFQEHPKRERVGDENYLRQLVAYIHLNPVKHQFSKDFRTYPHSSYSEYYSERETIIDRNYIVDLFDDLENFEKYHDFNQLKYLGGIEDVDDLLP